MADTGSPTNKLYGKCGALLAAVSQWLALDIGSEAGFTAATNALASECAGSGLTRAAATVTNPTTTVAGDTNQAYKSFSAGATATLTGAGIFSASSAGDMWAYHTYAVPPAVQNGDTLNETLSVQFEIGV